MLSCLRNHERERWNTLLTPKERDPAAGQTCGSVQVEGESRPPDHIIGEIGQAERQGKLALGESPDKANWSQDLTKQANQDEMAIARRIATCPPVGGSVDQDEHADAL